MMEAKNRGVAGAIGVEGGDRVADLCGETGCASVGAAGAAGMSKKERVEGMFDAIAPTYDALNHILSLGIDRLWRRRVVRMVAAGFREKRKPTMGKAEVAVSPNSECSGSTARKLFGSDRPYGARSERLGDSARSSPAAPGSPTADPIRPAAGPKILDVATGTGDLAIALARRIPGAHITGVDISERMLAIGREKIARLREKCLPATCPPLPAGHHSPDTTRPTLPARHHSPAAALPPLPSRRCPPDTTRNSSVGPLTFPERITLQTGDAEALDFPAETFDAVTVAFGVRNFGDIPTGLAEMHRVLKPGGRCFVLEFSEPTAPVFGALYRFYFHRVLPWLGRVVSRDGAAYSYLPRSVDEFPAPPRFSQMLRGAGFRKIRNRRLTFGVAHIYEAEK